MGHVSSVALGMAIAHPDKKIVVFDGDAAAVMHMGSLATIGRYQPKNLIHIVLNNGANESVGGQPSAGQVINLTQIAHACGYHTADSYIDSRFVLQSSMHELIQIDGPSCMDVHVRQGIRSDMPKLSINHRQEMEDLMQILHH